MNRIAAALVLLMLGMSAVRAEDLAEDFVTAFRLICLRKKPQMEALEDSAKSGRLHKPKVIAHGATSASKRMRPMPKGYRRNNGVSEIPAYSVSFYKQMEGMASGGSCHVSTFGKIDNTDILRPLVDQLSELVQPAGFMSAEERRRFGREGPNFIDPAWHVLGSPDSVVVLYYSEHMRGSTSLVRIERRH